MVLVVLVYLPGSIRQFVSPSSMLSKCSKTVYLHMLYMCVLVCVYTHIRMYMRAVRKVSSDVL